MGGIFPFILLFVKLSRTLMKINFGENSGFGLSRYKMPTFLLNLTFVSLFWKKQRRSGVRIFLIDF